MKELVLESATTRVVLRASDTNKGLEINIPGLGQVMSIQRQGQEIVAFPAMLSDYTLGTAFFVNSDKGNDNNDGSTWANAKKTIAAALSLAVAGDVIYITGTGFSEAVTLSVAGVSIIGVGTGPNMTTWTASADAVCLTVAASDALVGNIKFRPPAYGSGIPAAIQLGGANYARIIGNRFQGKAASWNAIYSPVCNSDNVEISDNEFIYMNTATYGAAILGVEAGGLCYSGWKIKRNSFKSCLTGINIAARVAEIMDNVIAEYGVNPAGAVAQLLALGIDLSGTNSGGNVVTRNQLGGTYGATLYKVGASGDQWAGNYNVLSGGVTAANPA